LEINENKKCREKVVINIRRYRSSDTDLLVDVFNAIESSYALPKNQLTRRLSDHEQAGGMTWIMVSDGELIGYATLSPVPALDGLFELGGGIRPAERRKGFGSRLLKHILNELRNGAVHQISYAVGSIESPVALFLSRNGFQVEHEEWRMDIDELSEIKPVNSLERNRLESFPRVQAIKMFRELYESSFAKLPWYQPYLSDAEVSAEMEDDDSLLFLVERGSPVGFIWFRWPEPKTAELEPIGIIRSRQGEGLGRYLLKSGLMRAAEQGAERVTIGVWSDNESAIHLYQDFGFRHDRTLTYLAYNVRSR
jgi:mycothiol synthase